MEKIEVVNQLEYVKAKVSAMTPKERARLAVEAGTTERTAFNVIQKDRKPSYETVYKVYAALMAREQEAAKQ